MRRVKCDESRSAQSDESETKSSGEFFLRCSLEITGREPSNLHFYDYASNFMGTVWGKPKARSPVGLLLWTKRAIVSLARSVRSNVGDLWPQLWSLAWMDEEIPTDALQNLEESLSTRVTFSLPLRRRRGDFHRAEFSGRPTAPKAPSCSASSY